MSRILPALALLCLSIPAPAPAAAPPQQPELLVFAAASLTNALQDIGTAYQKTTGVRVRMSFDASSNLAHQIEAGAPADVFFSADTEWMDYLESRHLIQPATRRDALGNQLVLIAPAGSQVSLRIAPRFPLAAALGQGRLAVADPDSVPAGRYARSALSALGVWDEVVDRLARAENVRAAMRYVGRGEAPLGIVYSSDALVDKSVRVVDTFPVGTHQPIVYPVALTTSARSEAKAFLAYLLSPQGREVFVKYGFTSP
jgi:molybdate transport system substrate-binding protein